VFLTGDAGNRIYTLVLEAFSIESGTDVHRVDARWTLKERLVHPTGTHEPTLSRQERKGPLTDSNRRPPPYQFRAVRAYARSFGCTFVLQINPSSRVARARACPRVLDLLYPSGTRDLLSIARTDNASRTLASYHNCRRCSSHHNRLDPVH
jgi:hypothetical protein